MKTAREIIIDALMETHYDASDNTRATNIANRLAAEGLSIVYAATVESVLTEMKEAEDNAHFDEYQLDYIRDWVERLSAVSRSTREGKTG